MGMEFWVCNIWLKCRNYFNFALVIDGSPTRYNVRKRKRCINEGSEAPSCLNVALHASQKKNGKEEIWRRSIDSNITFYYSNICCNDVIQWWQMPFGRSTVHVAKLIFGNITPQRPNKHSHLSIRNITQEGDKRNSPRMRNWLPPSCTMMTLFRCSTRFMLAPEAFRPRSGWGLRVCRFFSSIKCFAFPTSMCDSRCSMSISVTVSLSNWFQSLSGIMGCDKLAFPCAPHPNWLFVSSCASAIGRLLVLPSTSYLFSSISSTTW